MRIAGHYVALVMFICGPSVARSEESVPTEVKTMEDLNYDRLKVETELKRLRDQLEEAERRGKNSAAEADSLKTRIKEKEQELLDVQSQRALEIQKNSNLTKQVTGLQTTVDGLNTEIQSLKEQLESIYSSKSLEAVLTVEVGSSVLDTKADASDPKITDDNCSIRITIKDGKCRSSTSAQPTFKDCGIEKIDVVDIGGEAQARLFALDPDKIAVTRTNISMSGDEVCGINKKTLGNETRLAVRIRHRMSTGSISQTDDYYFLYNKRAFQLEASVGPYAAAGGIGSLEQRQFSILPSLRIGVRLNVSLFDSARDFFLQLNGVVGAGVTTVSQPSPSADPMTTPSSFALLLGGSLEISRYVDIGMGYDFVGGSTLLLIGAGRLLTGSIFAL